MFPQAVLPHLVPVTALIVLCGSLLGSALWWLRNRRRLRFLKAQRLAARLDRRSDAHRNPRGRRRH